MINNPNKKTQEELDADANRDPITDEPGSHPVGTGLGAASGAAAGAAIGTVAAGPLGTATGGVVGAIVGGIAGGYAGKGIAEVINPTEIHDYWRGNYETRSYVTPGSEYEKYSPAYSYGYEARAKTPAKSFEEVESELGKNWESSKLKSQLKWEEAKEAVRDSYNYTGDAYNKKVGNSSASSTTGSKFSGSDKI
jgi:hypothetical protein